MRSDPPCRQPTSRRCGARPPLALEDLQPPPWTRPWRSAAPPPRCACWWAPSWDPESLQRGDLTGSRCIPAAEAQERLGIAPERARLLPAGMILLQEVSARLGRRPLRVAQGGLREGALLEFASARRTGIA